ncbi:MAG: TolC family protein [Bacteroidia bacterium]|nr:TolC family protein [Bacteroidia bacterium]
MRYINHSSYWLTLFLCLWGSGIALQAQSPVLNEYIQLGLQNNRSLQTQQLSYEKSKAALREAKGMFMPYLSFNATYSLAGGGRSLDFPVGDLLNPINATLNQLTETNAFPTTIENVNEQFAPNNFQETKLRMIQPLYNPALGINRKAKEAQIEVQANQRDAFKQELVRDIRLAYFSWLQTQEVLNIYKESESLIKEIIRVNRSLVRNEKATPVVISRSEFELSKIRKDKSLAEAQSQTARAYFNFLLNRPLETEIKKDEVVKEEEILLSMDQLSEQALNNRIEIAQLKSAQKAQEQALNLNESAGIPRLNLVADGGFQGFGYDFGNQGYWLALVSLEWDLFTGNQRKARIQQSKLDQRSLQIREQELNSQIQLQVRQNWYELEAAKSRIKSDTQGLRAAKESFRLTQKLYKENKASLLELLDARTQFTQSQLTLTLDTYSLLSKQAELQWASGEVR